MPQRASRFPSLPKPRSPLGRAALPVLGGFGVLVLIFAATWGMAAWISRGGAESTSRLAPTTFPVGDVSRVAETIDESGPVLYPGLNTTTGERTLVLNHTGTDATREWRVYWAYPADRDPSCAVEQVRQSDRFTDCDGREVDVADLAAPDGVCPVVEDRQRLSINLRCDDSVSRAAATADVRINQIQVLGTHNSYHVEPPAEILDAYIDVDPDAADLAYTHSPLTTQLDEQGIRQFELDLAADPDGTLFRPIGTPGWKVLHIEQIDERSTCETFAECLEELRDWSVDHPGHVPLTVLVEFKIGGEIEGGVDVPPVTPELLVTFDAAVRSVFGPDQLITPDDVRGDHETLEAAVLAGSWPTLDDARGRIMFVLNDHRDEYVDGDPSLTARVAFPNAPVGSPDAAFLLLNDPITEADDIRAAVELGYLVRTRADVPVGTAQSGDVTQRDAAFASGAQFVSTDFPVPGISDRWATDYVAQLPGGGTVRCNPVNAPPGCDSAVLEILD